jgi:hypothetical protein
MLPQTTIGQAVLIKFQVGRAKEQMAFLPSCFVSIVGLAPFMPHLRYNKSENPSTVKPLERIKLRNVPRQPRDYRGLKASPSDQA